MSNLTVKGNASGTGTVILEAPNTNSNRTITLPDATATLASTAYVDSAVATAARMVSGTAVASTSGTSIDFTGIPSWAKRVTVMLSGVSFASNPGIIQFLVGTSGGFASSYFSAVTNAVNFNTESTLAGNLSTFSVAGNGSTTDGTTTWHGRIVLSNLSSNTWAMNGFLAQVGTGASSNMFGGSVVLSDVLDRIRVTNSATTAFDAGSINIMYEG